MGAGVRTAYEAIPSRVRAWVERELGSGVVRATTQVGGFSPGAAARLVTASGRRAFVKAVGAELNPQSPLFFRQEIVVMEALDPLGLRMAPRLLGSYDDGTWVALLLEDVDGHVPPHPWTRGNADRVLAAVSDLTAALTPSPWSDTTIAAERSNGFLTGWDRAAAEGLPVPSWVDGRVDEMLALAARGRQAVAADECLVHWDVRADNVLLTGDRVVFVDWAWAARGARWADLVIIQADIRGSLSGLPDLPENDGITGFLAAVAGGLWHQSHQPDPPGLPTLRAFQREYATAALAWLRRRLGW